MKKYLPVLQISLIIVAFVGVVLLYRSVEEAVRARSIQPVPTSAQLAEALLRSGLTPEALTAAGASSNGTDTVIADVFFHLLENPGALGLADAAYANARRDSDRLKRLIQSGQGTSEDVDAYAAAKMALAFAESQRETVLGAIFAAATSGLSASETNTLAALRSNGNWSLPTEFLVVDHAEAEWVQLREALANERIAAKLGEEPDPDAQALLATFRSDPLVAVAAANLDTNLPAVEAAWDTAVGD